MNIVKYESLEQCMDKNVVPFVVCLTKNDKRTPKIDDFINRHYGITIDKRGYVCCICNVILAGKCRRMGYNRIRFKDKTYKNISTYIPLKNEQLDGKVIVDIVFDNGEKLNSIELVEVAVKDIEKGKILVNAE